MQHIVLNYSYNSLYIFNNSHCLDQCSKIYFDFITPIHFNSYGYSLITTFVKELAYLVSVEWFYGFNHRDFGAPTSHIYCTRQVDVLMLLRNDLIWEKSLNTVAFQHMILCRRHGLFQLLRSVATINLTLYQRSSNLLCYPGFKWFKTKTKALRWQQIAFLMINL